MLLLFCHLFLPADKLVKVREYGIESICQYLFDIGLLFEVPPAGLVQFRRHVFVQLALRAAYPGFTIG